MQRLCGAPGAQDCTLTCMCILLHLLNSLHECLPPCVFDEIRGRSFPLFGLQTLIPILSTYLAFQEKVNTDINRRISAAVASAKSLLIFRAHRQLVRQAAHPSPEQTEVNLHLFCFAPPSPLLPHPIHELLCESQGCSPAKQSCNYPETDSPYMNIIDHQ